METFRSIHHAMREERAARMQRTVEAGPGHRFCQRHNIRFAIKDGGCPTCFPPRRRYRVR